MGVSKSDAILIVGGGAFGLSTAYHLAQKGYSNISVFERDDHIPPRYSAANDLNKIVRAEYEDPFYTDLTIVCMPDGIYPFKPVKFILISPYYRKQSRRGRPPCSRLISTRLASSTVCLAKRPRRQSIH